MQFLWLSYFDTETWIFVDAKRSIRMSEEGLTGVQIYPDNMVKWIETFADGSSEEKVVPIICDKTAGPSVSPSMSPTVVPTSLPTLSPTNDCPTFLVGSDCVDSNGNPETFPCSLLFYSTTCCSSFLKRLLQNCIF